MVVQSVCKKVSIFWRKVSNGWCIVGVYRHWFDEKVVSVGACEIAIFFKRWFEEEVSLGGVGKKVTVGVS